MPNQKNKVLVKRKLIDQVKAFCGHVKKELPKLMMTKRPTRSNKIKPWRLTIHCSATRNGVSLKIDTIDKWHRARGFKMVGYHCLIDIDGSKEWGRGLMQRGAHVGGANSGNLGICLVGTDKFLAVQFRELRQVLNSLRMTYDIKFENIFCHNQFKSAIRQGKTCPNMQINNLLVWYITWDEKALSGYKLNGG